jgi:peptidoglycan/LPS O-acetylase OafA/YrhL
LSLGMPFAVGVTFYLAQRQLPLHPAILVGLILATVQVKGTGLYQPMVVLAICYGVFVLAYLPQGIVTRYNALGDYSYGVYIYAWPVQQSVIHYFGSMDPLTNIALALPVTMALAWLSWTLVEKPALALVPHSDPIPQSDPDGATPSRNR